MITAIRRLVVVLVATATVAAGCSAVPGLGPDTYTVTAFFPRAISLFPESQVRVLGLPAGSVSAVVVEGDRVRVDMDIETDVPLPTFVQAFLRPRSLIGERVVELTPAYVDGDPQAEDGHVIPLDGTDCGRSQDQPCTVVPVEPDEALAALKEFLDTLDPNGIGRLIDNAAGTLEGNGERLNAAIGSVADLFDLLADNDDKIFSIFENIDQFSATLLTRERQIGDVMRSFADATEVLAAERQALTQLVRDIAALSDTGLRLVSEHGDDLRATIQRLERVTEVVTNNLDSVGLLVEAGVLIGDGLRDAYDPDFRSLRLRNVFGPVAEDAFNTFLEAIGEAAGIDLPALCVPVDTVCEGGPLAGVPPVTETQLPAASAGAPVPASVELRESSPSIGDQMRSGARSVGGFFGDLAGTLVGVG